MRWEREFNLAAAAQSEDPAGARSASADSASFCISEFMGACLRSWVPRHTPWEIANNLDANQCSESKLCDAARTGYSVVHNEDVVRPLVDPRRKHTDCRTTA